MIHIIVILLEVYLWGVLFPRALLSWFPVAPGSPIARINTVLYRLSEPVLGPVRRMLPPLRAGNMGIDLSFLVVFFGIQILIVVVLRAT